MLVKLRAAGAIQSLEPAEGDREDAIERPALLVYAGEFESADGPVTVTPEQVKLLVATHNALLSRVKRLASGEVPVKHYPPIQVDHSTSGWDTVGRLCGELEEGDYELSSGARVPAVYAKRLRILGKENVERVRDGRWTHLSLGADFTKGLVSELSVVPFPAAAEASMLSGKKPGADQDPPKDPESHSMDPEKLKKLKAYLTGHKKMSDKDADDHLSRLSQAEHADELKKLSAEADEAAVQEDKKQNEAKLAAAREGITRLAGGFQASLAGARLAAKQGRIVTRLSRLRAHAKITPAEIKKVDLAKLAAQDDAAIELVLGTYESREPVILVGQLGSTKAANVARVGKAQAMTRLEAETRANMSLLAGKDGATTRLSQESGATEGPAEKPTTGGVSTEGQDDLAFVQREHDELTRMMAEGKHEEVKTRLKAFLTKCVALAGASPEHTETEGEETEKQLSALQDAVSKMQSSFDDLQRLAGDLAGVTRT